MKKQDDLFELISGMSKAEKINFKLISDQRGSNKLYIELFDLIDRQKTYDEEAVKSKLKLSRTKMARTKHYLFQNILNSLATYQLHVENYVLGKVTRNTLLIRVFLKKGQFNIADKLYGKTFDLAMEHELILPALHLIDLYIYRHFDMYDTNEINGYYNQRVELLDNLKAEYFFENLHMLSRPALLKYNDESIEDFENKMSKVSILEKDLPATSRARNTFYNVGIKYYCRQGEFNKARKLNRRWLSYLYDIRKEQSALFRWANLMNALANMIGLEYISKQFDHCNELLDELNTYKSNVGRENIPWHTYLYNSYKAQCSIHLGEIDSARIHTEALERFADSNIDKMQLEMAVYIHHALACQYFVMGEQSRALKWLNLLVAETSNNRFGQIHLMSKIILAIILFETNKLEAMQSILRSIWRSLKSGVITDKSSKHLAKILWEISNYNPDDDLAKVFKLARNELSHFEQEMNSSRFFVNFDFIKWFDSKIEGKSILEMMKVT